MNKLNIKNLIFAGLMVIALVLSTAPNKSFANTPGFYVLSGKYNAPTNTNSNSSSNTSSSTKPNPSPIITKINPNNIALNSGTQEIVITGTGFTTSSVAKLNGNDRPTTYVSATRLLMEVNAEDTKQNGKNIVTVFNPSPEGGYSNGVFLTIGNGGQVAGATTTKPSNTGTKATKNTKAVTQPATPVIGSNVNTNGNGEVSGANDSNQNSFLEANVSRTGFIPNTIFGWLLLAILILLAILLWRRIWVKDADRKANTLKHA